MEYGQNSKLASLQMLSDAIYGKLESNFSTIKT